MRILIWSEAFWPYVGGIELFLTRLAKGFGDRGHAVQVLTAHGELDLPDEDSFEGIPVRRIDLFRAFQQREPEAVLRLKRSVAELVSQFQPDIIHLNPMGPGAILLVSAADRSSALVVTIQSGLDGLRSAASDTALGSMLQRASWVTAGARTALDRVLALAPQVAAISSVIPSGIEVPRSEPPAAPFTPPRLLCVGRLIRMKGFDVAVDAFARLQRDFPTLDMIIVGDGPDRRDLEAQAAAQGLSSKLALVGWKSQADVAALMDGATIVVMPSRQAGTEYTEGLALVALEAAARGRAVVASRVGGLPEAVVHEVTGLLVEPEDPAALAQAIASLLADPERTAAMGRAGWERVWQRCRWDLCFEAYEHLFSRLAGSQARRVAAEDA